MQHLPPLSRTKPLLFLLVSRKDGGKCAASTRRIPAFPWLSCSHFSLLAFRSPVVFLFSMNRKAFSEPPAPPGVFTNLIKIAIRRVACVSPEGQYLTPPVRVTYLKRVLKNRKDTKQISSYRRSIYRFSLAFYCFLQKKYFPQYLYILSDSPCLFLVRIIILYSTIFFCHSFFYFPYQILRSQS